jgi:hypothetical protein
LGYAQGTEYLTPVSVTTVEGVSAHPRLAVLGRPVTANRVSLKGKNACGTRVSHRRYQIRTKQRVFVRNKN